MSQYIPLTIDKTWDLLLPEKVSRAYVISKGAVPIRWSTRGIPHSTLKLILTFELADGTRLAFPAKSMLYHTLLGEKGLLVYKGQGSRNYFVRFERENSKPNG